jgi:hypothetical protein
MLGKALVVLSWQHEDDIGTYRDPEDEAQEETE